MEVQQQRKTEGALEDQSFSFGKTASVLLLALASCKTAGKDLPPVTAPLEREREGVTAVENPSAPPLELSRVEAKMPFSELSTLTLPELDETTKEAPIVETPQEQPSETSTDAKAEGPATQEGKTNNTKAPQDPSNVPLTGAGTTTTPPTTSNPGKDTTPAGDGVNTTPQKPDGAPTKTPKEQEQHGKERATLEIGKYKIEVNPYVALALSAIAIIGGAVATGRGVWKAVHSAWNYFHDRANFISGRSLSTPSVNLHSFHIDGEKVEFSVSTMSMTTLTDLFPNTYSRHVFRRACDLCTPEQPFPTLNFAAATALRPILWLGLTPRETEKSANVLRETNRIIRGSYSSLYREGIIAHDIGAPHISDAHYVITICEVDATKGRDLIFIPISERNFERFSDAAFVQKLADENPNFARRFQQLAQAYSIHRTHYEAHGDYIFPRVRTYERVQDARVPPGKNGEIQIRQFIEGQGRTV